MQATISEGFEARIQSNGTRDLIDATLDVLSPFSVKYVCYLSFGRSKTGEVPCIETNYPKGWFDRYHERDYFRIDPVVAVGRNSFRPVNWQQVKKSCREVRDFFGEASEFGLCENGLSIPIRDAENRSALVTFNTASPDSEWDTILGKFGAELRCVALLFHLYYNSSHQNQNEDHLQLSERELQVLSWAAAGKSSWETSKILSLSQRTVDGYLRNCIRKLGVANKTQAVAVAVSYELLETQLFHQRMT